MNLLVVSARSVLVCASSLIVGALQCGDAGAADSIKGKTVVSTAVAFDVSRPAREIAPSLVRVRDANVREIPSDRGPAMKDQGYSGDGALAFEALRLAFDGVSDAAAPTLQPPFLTFEGLSNQDNFNLFGGRVNPPDPVGDIGPGHYVEMVNLAFAVYDRWDGTLLSGPTAIGDLWAGFAVEDCTDPSGDPIVIHDQFADRWILTQFTTRGLDDPTLPFYNCVAISQTSDPTGAYYRYAFTSGFFFPDYPKYGVWTNAYLLTSRDFGPTTEYGISVYALERARMLAGNPNARAVQFFLDSDVVPLHLIGDGLLPADIDGRRKPKAGAPAIIVGTQDDGGPYGAPSDALNIYELSVTWGTTPSATFVLADQLATAPFDSIFPCAPDARDCLPQPGIVNPAQFLDVLSYRQRPIHRLAYRNFGTYEALVTNQSVEARPGIAGTRWYEIRRDAAGNYSIHQQGTYSPNDGVHRWMGSIAMDRSGNIALGYSVVDGASVYPGIRYTGRRAKDPLGQMTLGEGTIINGTGVQTTTNSRWGDYTSMNVDPLDDCAFWYVNEYYTAAGQASSPAGWQTRIAAFCLPGCRPPRR
jgi:hypothetical protein